MITPLSGAPTCWVAGFLRSPLSGGRTSKFSPMAVKSTSSAKDPSAEWSEFQATRWSFLSLLAAAKLRRLYSLAPAVKDTSHAKRLEMFAGSGGEQQGSTFIHTS